LPRVVHTAVPLVTRFFGLLAVLIAVCLVTANVGYLAVLPATIVNTSSTLALVENTYGGS